jgi:hypothetical protein
MSETATETATQAVETAKVKKAKKEPKAKVKVSIPEVLKWLEDGLDRKEIAAKLGLNFTQLKALFQHKDLKGKKTHTNPADAFEIVEELPAGSEATEEKASEAVAETATSEAIQEKAPVADASGW